MSTLRRLAVAGAFALPLSLVIAGPATAHPLGWPHDSWSAETSSSWAGIGGAGTTDTEEGTTWWGHHWSEQNSAVAGIGGAAVTHSGESGHDWYDGDDDCDCDADDDYDGPAVTHHHVMSHPDPVDQEPAGHVIRPVYDTDDDDGDDDDSDVGYHAEQQSAGVDGATSAHVVSHAGEHHAVYQAEKLTAGPFGASSEGAHAVAVPDYAGYHAWYTAAGVGGAAAHSVTSVADATEADDDDWVVDHDVDSETAEDDD
ncbi:hypothetical protein SAMN04489727_5086 [Amycolatopsis tolypomycina]|uniref:Uncharacterized protein n=1 Tax=Amycolatopsis tolypomycina TaxID=208445 RepID=A0A1H4VDQ1_9PSEU|nr:hypothetical protein [Amycolatopsis tolypomycina]SEC78728.1 hypothetical protein SAMN04489727_5086 [Amycolatopsis tolypomycina]